MRENPGETIELAFFALDELLQEIAFGHKKADHRRAQSISGISMRQKIKGPDRKRLARREPYEWRDQSGLSRQEFYLQQLK
jgi:hypothetical protein